MNPLLMPALSRNLQSTLFGDGAAHFKGALSPEYASQIAHFIWENATERGWYRPTTPGGKPFSVSQMNFGPLGWISDRSGYRYSPSHPETGEPWPALPEGLQEIWQQLIGTPEPQCCLVNHYTQHAKMGLHLDADEDDQETPILSISLGQSARFRLGGPMRGGKTSSIILDHGDIVVLGGASRRYYHGIDRLLPQDLLSPHDCPFEGRLNITLRRVTKVTENAD